LRYMCYSRIGSPQADRLAAHIMSRSGQEILDLLKTAGVPLRPPALALQLVELPLELLALALQRLRRGLPPGQRSVLDLGALRREDRAHLAMLQRLHAHSGQRPGAGAARRRVEPLQVGSVE
jgi:hypothetical protein